MGLIVVPWKFDVLKSSIFTLDAWLLGQTFVLRTSDFRGGQLSADSSSTETLYCLNGFEVCREQLGYKITLKRESEIHHN